MVHLVVLNPVLRATTKKISNFFEEKKCTAQRKFWLSLWICRFVKKLLTLALSSHSSAVCVCVCVCSSELTPAVVLGRPDFLYEHSLSIAPCGAGAPLFHLCTFLFLSLALPIFFFCPSLPFLPE